MEGSYEVIQQRWAKEELSVEKELSDLKRMISRTRRKTDVEPERRRILNVLPSFDLMVTSNVAWRRLSLSPGRAHLGAFGESHV
ncbi:unnamed protein product [Cyprideis torosa]|uniref:Uncharacterized protein n=1 Tax=Cyprideis torosa TaxID=163714 RepID=A0A7R8ZK30_9CRUS|nr:unnamed protein product [Cyprideis torosa]CAG0880881.1 unnamed protein product [Cyprideis torosa]